MSDSGVVQAPDSKGWLIEELTKQTKMEERLSATVNALEKIKAEIIQAAANINRRLYEEHEKRQEVDLKSVQVQLAKCQEEIVELWEELYRMRKTYENGSD